MAIDRRQFLRRSGAVLLTGWAAVGCSEPDDDGVLARPTVLTVLGAEQVRHIGRTYREMVPAEREAHALRRAILQARQGAGVPGTSADAGLEQLVRAEFDEGRTVVVDGWILSVTEARQCALFSLLAA